MKNKIFAWLDRLSTTTLDKNSTLQRVDRDAYKYVENDHAMIVVVEMQSGNPDYVLYVASVDKWLPPFEQDAVAQFDKDRIIDKVRAYLDSRHIYYRVE